MSPAPGTQVLRLTTGAVAFDLIIDAAAQAEAAPVLDCLGGYFGPRPAGEAPELTFALRAAAAFDADLAGRAVRPMALRRSSAAPFNLDLRLLAEAGPPRMAYDPATGTGYLIDHPARRIALFLTENSLFHVIETVRYTLLVAEQNKGALILHASAAQQEDGSLALVLGEKGRGKTTTLLRLILGRGMRYFSGDKVLADCPEGRLRLRGWPDFAHVGIGTLSSFPALARACDVALCTADGHPRPPGEKVLIAPARLAAALGAERAPARAGRAAFVLLPDVRVDQPSLRHIGTAERQARLADLIEDARIFLPGTWHGLLPPMAPAPPDAVFAALDHAAWYELRGKADLPAIPGLAVT